MREKLSAMLRQYVSTHPGVEPRCVTLMMIATWLGSLDSELAPNNVMHLVWDSLGKYLGYLEKQDGQWIAKISQYNGVTYTYTIVGKGTYMEMCWLLEKPREPEVPAINPMCGNCGASILNADPAEIRVVASKSHITVVSCPMCPVK